MFKVHRGNIGAAQGKTAHVQTGEFFPGAQERVECTQQSPARRTHRARTVGVADRHRAHMVMPKQYTLRCRQGDLGHMLGTSGGTLAMEQPVMRNIRRDSTIQTEHNARLLDVFHCDFIWPRSAPQRAPAPPVKAAQGGMQVHRPVPQGLSPNTENRVI
jgi:hypothetical protein